MRSYSFWLAFVLLGAFVVHAHAADLRGVVTFKGLPVPGASVTASRDGKTVTVVTDTSGAYAFTDLNDGSWTVSVEMFGFTTVREQIDTRSGTRSDSAPRRWELSLLTLGELEKYLRVAPTASQRGS